MKKIALILFLLASGGELISTLASVQMLDTICKPLIMVSLGLFYFFSVDAEDRSALVLGAIIFSFTGDVLLMYPDKFILGLAAFLFSHICYILAYRQHRGDDQDNALKGVHRIRLAFPVILAGCGLVVILYPVLGDLKIPVIIYAIVISTMVLTALFRMGKTSTTSFWMVFIGAMLFMVSDSILAINKFLSPITLSGFWIMLTYITAQFLIVSGLLKHDNQIL
jgi:uncharacterized membrane protein YhhN